VTSLLQSGVSPNFSHMVREMVWYMYIVYKYMYVLCIHIYMHMYVYKLASCSVWCGSLSCMYMHLITVCMYKSCLPHTHSVMRLPSIGPVVQVRLQWSQCYWTMELMCMQWMRWEWSVCHVYRVYVHVYGSTCIYMYVCTVYACIHVCQSEVCVG